MQKKQAVKFAAFLLCLMMTLTLSVTALAYEPIDNDHLTSLTLNVTEDDPKNPGTAIALAGVNFHLYRIATVSADVSYTLTDAFAESGIDLNAIDDAGDMSEAADKLQAFISENSVADTMNAISDTQGTLTFKDMKPGVFLVLGDAMENGGYAYSFSPVMVALPMLDVNDWIYDLTSDLKMERTEQYMQLTIIKTWAKDSNHRSRRPSKIEIDLLCDGEIAATVELNKANGWKYTFESLSAAHEWTLQEHEFSKYYTPTYGELEYDSKEEAHITVTNTYKNPTPGVPQTGMLWWPVPVLAFAGLLLFVTGWMMNRKGKQQ